MKPRTHLAEWQRAQVDSGRTLRWLAEQTGKSYHTVRAYNLGNRVPPETWIEQVIDLCRPAAA